MAFGVHHRVASYCTVHFYRHTITLALASIVIVATESLQIRSLKFAGAPPQLAAAGQDFSWAVDGTAWAVSGDDLPVALWPPALQ